MREKMARAIGKALTDGLIAEPLASALMQASEGDLQPIFDAALNELMKPTEAMREAGEHGDTQSGDSMGAWMAMLRAAKEGK